MKYTVTWSPAALSKLAELWEQAPDRGRITEAANSIDILLGRSAVEAGESRQENTRFLYVAPLAVYFDVFPDDYRVRVWAIWQRESN